MVYLLDTNHLIHVRNQPRNVVQQLDDVADEDRVVTSAVAVAELMYGAECSSRRAENIEVFERQLQLLDDVLPFTPATARVFGSLKANLRRKGRRKADVDLL